MAYTDIDDPSDYFNTLLYAGNDSNRSFSGVGFQPDWVWVKARDNTTWHIVFDSVRGAVIEGELHPNDDAAEGASNNALYGYLSSFDSDGFSTVNGSNASDALNQNGKTFVAWNWKAGTSVSGNTTGSGTAKAYSGSVNTDAGFSITTFTGNGTANHTLPHGLSSIPSMFIIKKRIGTGDGTDRDWNVYHQSLGNTKVIFLNTNAATSTSAEYWNNISPTSSVINLGTNDQINGDNNTYICYAFAEKKGYSKFSSYTGNGNADGTFVYTGFKPAFVMIKKTTGTDGWWQIEDNKRSSGNVAIKALFANVNDTEYSGANYATDYLSNGFKIRNNTAGSNTGGQVYIYMAFAENPFVSSTGVPATAR